MQSGRDPLARKKQAGIQRDTGPGERRVINVQ